MVDLFVCPWGSIIREQEVRLIHLIPAVLLPISRVGCLDTGSQTWSLLPATKKTICWSSWHCVWQLAVLQSMRHQHLVFAKATPNIIIWTSNSQWQCC